MRNPPKITGGFFVVKIAIIWYNYIIRYRYEVMVCWKTN